MTRQSAVVFVAENPLQMRIVGTALCQDLGREINRLENGRVEFADLKDLYESIYQPKAIGLVHALLHHIPGTCPDITGGPKPSAVRQLTTSTDLDSVREPLHRDYMVTQLKGVVKTLTCLLEFVRET